MKRLKFNPIWVVYTCVVFWVIALLSLVTTEYISNSSVLSISINNIVYINLFLTIVSAIILIFGLGTRKPNNENSHHSPIAKILASLIVFSVGGSVITAIKSLAYDPHTDFYGDRFIYENIATGMGFAGIVLTIYLNALQKDIYWVARKKKVALDERQLQQRREVFEKSYKISTFIVITTVICVGINLHDLPTVIANNFGSVPGHLKWIGVNLIVALYSLPLIIATLQKRHPNKSKQKINQ